MGCHGALLIFTTPQQCFENVQLGFLSQRSETFGRDGEQVYLRLPHRPPKHRDRTATATPGQPPTHVEQTPLPHETGQRFSQSSIPTIQTAGCQQRRSGTGSLGPKRGVCLDRWGGRGHTGEQSQGRLEPHPPSGIHSPRLQACLDPHLSPEDPASVDVTGLAEPLQRTQVPPASLLRWSSVEGPGTRRACAAQRLRHRATST